MEPYDTIATSHATPYANLHSHTVFNTARDSHTDRPAWAKCVVHIINILHPVDSGVMFFHFAAAVIKDLVYHVECIDGCQRVPGFLVLIVGPETLLSAMLLL